MTGASEQIYSATYSNVPVFEFVTEEGPIMRRKSDSWINATHILKIAKFPKARRTRILEKDVQTGIHEKVQGGYGKYQGTYVPLDLGAEIARSFGVFDVLRPIFEFQYVEGRSATPPPAPKHNHASASNVARRQLQQQQKSSHQKREMDGTEFVKRQHDDDVVGDYSKKRGRPKRVALTGRSKPDLLHSQTMPIEPGGPSMGTFSARQESSFSLGQHLPSLVRQDTERDALLAMTSNLNVKREDLEPESSDGENDDLLRKRSDNFAYRDTDDDELMSGKELFGSRGYYHGSRDSFEKAIHTQKAPRHSDLHNVPKLLSINGSVSDAYGLMQYHHQQQPQLKSNSLRGDPKSVEYFNTLLNYFLEDDPQNSSAKSNKFASFSLPEKILNPPQPLSKININQPIDNDGNTIFHWACSMANIPMIEFLLSIFSNFVHSELKNFHGETPLMFLVQFNNSYQQKNFPAIFDILFDSVLSVDNNGRTALHHIAIACSTSKRNILSRTSNDLESKDKKERFAKYYMDVILSRIIEFHEFQLLQGNKARSFEDKKEVISKFINHQDHEGNTAFHITAYNLSKRCIKTFIKYHKYIDFDLRNYVNYTVEDYLASHNYVLRLENGEEGDELMRAHSDSSQSGATLFPAEHTQSFETQVHHTKLATNLQSSTANIITEKLTELSFAIDKELSGVDEKLFSLYKYFRVVGLEKFKSQKAVLQLFNLDYLLEDLEKEYQSESSSSQKSSKASDSMVLDGSRDKIIQDEISRLQNDVCFQALTLKDDISKLLANYKKLREKDTCKRLKQLEASFLSEGVQELEEDRTELATRLQREILKRMELAEKIYLEEREVPLCLQYPEEFKENQKVADEDTASNEEDPLGGGNSNGDVKSLIANFPHSDRLYKYCKLIALSCGMTFAEVENSIDLIEQSLSKTTTT